MSDIFGYDDLCCPYCGGSGHKDDVSPRHSNFVGSQNTANLTDKDDPLAPNLLAALKGLEQAARYHDDKAAQYEAFGTSDYQISMARFHRRFAKDIRAMAPIAATRKESAVLVPVAYIDPDDIDEIKRGGCFVDRDPITPDFIPLCRLDEAAERIAVLEAALEHADGFLASKGYSECDPLVRGAIRAALSQKEASHDAA